MELERFGRFYLFTFLPFPYQALQSPQQFVGYVAGIAGDAEAFADLHRLEVRVVRAVGATRHRDVVAIVNARIALRSWLRHYFRKGEVRVAAKVLVDDALLVKLQHARIALRRSPALRQDWVLQVKRMYQVPDTLFGHVWRNF